MTAFLGRQCMTSRMPGIKNQADNQSMIGLTSSGGVTFPGYGVTLFKDANGNGSYCSYKPYKSGSTLVSSGFWGFQGEIVEVMVTLLSGPALPSSVNFPASTWVMASGSGIISNPWNISGISDYPVIPGASGSVARYLQIDYRIRGQSSIFATFKEYFNSAT